MNELEALVILSSIPYLGQVKIKQLLKIFGSALKALHADIQQIEELPGFGNKISEGFKKWQGDPKWKHNLQLSKKYGVEIIPWTDPKYPRSLLQISDFPLMLYVLGEIKEKDQMSVAVIGTRQASIYGLDMTERFSRNLTEKGFTVISGLARGIDTAAHKAALEKGRTLAVIGSGIGDIYPKENLKLALEEIPKNGALISEFSIMTPPDRQNFPRRNRIVSALSLGTLLIEAPVKSGAMITMEMAISQRKKLFAIPGRVDSENFAGNHMLIKNRHAELVENVDDICKSLNCFNLDFSNKTEKKQTILLQNHEWELMDKLPEEEFSIEEASLLSQMPTSKLNVLLMGLVLKKAIKEYPGKMYKKIGRE